MKKLKFRAIIKERNATIYFTLADLIKRPYPTFSIREILTPWLLAGNKPDEYIGIRDKNGKEIYNADIVNLHTREEIGYPDPNKHTYKDRKCVISWDEGDMEYSLLIYNLPNFSWTNWFFLDNEDEWIEVIGNSSQNQELLREVRDGQIVSSF